jgi:hypothetical protein
LFIIFLEQRRKKHPTRQRFTQVTAFDQQKKMGNQMKLNVFLVVILLTIWTTTTHASNAMMSNVKSFAAGGVGGKRIPSS